MAISEGLESGARDSVSGALGLAVGVSSLEMVFSEVGWREARRVADIIRIGALPAVNARAFFVFWF